MNSPIFIVGTGRCGSSIFYQIMAEHPGVAFLTGLTERYPSCFWLHRSVMRAWGQPLLGRLTRSVVGPAEGWKFWSGLARGFDQPVRDLRADDVTQEARERLRSAVPRLLTSRRNRLLAKLTGWTRIGYIKEVFPDAKIIHVIRQAPAVVNSWVNSPFWRGWRGPNLWRWGPLTTQEEEIWERLDRSFIVLAAIAYGKIVNAYQDSLGQLGESQRGDVLEVRYEELCQTRVDVLEKVLEFSGLSPTVAFMRRAKSFNVTSQNAKWRSNFSPLQQKQLASAMEAMGLDRPEGL